MTRFEYVDTIERVGDLIVLVVPDQTEGSSPREWDQLGHMLCWHPKYVLGDEQFQSPEDVGGSTTMAEIAEWLKTERGAMNLIPLFLYDHSGISISAGETIPDDEPATDEQTTVERGSFGSRTITGGYAWDTSMIGFIYTTPELIEKMGAPLDSIDRQLRGEVEEYDDFLTGNVWGYVVVKPCTDPGHAERDDSDEQIANCPHSEVLDSVWGFIGDPKYALEEGTASAQWSSEHGNVSAIA